MNDSSAGSRSDAMRWFGIEGYEPPWVDDLDFIVWAQRTITGYGLILGPAKSAAFWFLLWNLWAITPDWQRTTQGALDDALGLWNIPEEWRA